MKHFLAILFVSLALATVRAQGSGIGWTAHASTENVASYKVWEHVGTSFNLLATVPWVAPPVTQMTWYPTGWVAGSLHLLSVSAINVEGVEGQRCADLRFPIPPTPVGLKVIP